MIIFLSIYVFFRVITDLRYTSLNNNHTWLRVYKSVMCPLVSFTIFIWKVTDLLIILRDYFLIVLRLLIEKSRATFCFISQSGEANKTIFLYAALLLNLSYVYELHTKRDQK